VSASLLTNTTWEQGCSHHLRVAQAFLPVEGKGKGRYSRRCSQIRIRNADLQGFFLTLIDRIFYKMNKIQRYKIQDTRYKDTKIQG